MAAPLSTASNFADSIGTMSAGMHSGLAPTLLQPNQAAFAVNATFRGGYIGTRPPLLKIPLTYPDNPTMVAASMAIFQGAAFYSSYGNNPSGLIASIGGRIFKYTLTGRTGKVQELTPKDSDGNLKGNDPTLKQAWLAQGQDFMVINDGQSQPLVFDGATCYRLSAPLQLPVGRQIHYVNGRFIVAIPPAGGGPARSYIASDLVYNNKSGTPAYDYRDAILYTKDNAAILAGASFAVPLNAGPITALFSVAIPDTSLGQGPLQVATTNGIFSVNLPLDATLWTTTEQPTQTVSLPNGGITGGYAVTTVNGDAWYRSPDGIRSFITARRDFNTWVQTALSFEMDRVLPYDTPFLLDHVSTVNFNNRLLVTCSPYDTRGRGIAHRGLIALDFNNISSLTIRSQPCYDGLWTGQPVLQLLKGSIDGQERCFAFCLDGQGNICLYELGLDDASLFDSDGTSDVPTTSWFESGSLLGREGDPRYIVLKRLIRGDLYLSSLAGAGSGTIPISVSYVSDQLPCWQEWAGFSLCARSCNTPTDCTQPIPVHPSYATFLCLPQPSDDINSVTCRPYRVGYSFQIRMAWSGHLEMRRFVDWATPQPEPQNVQCNIDSCKLIECCPTPLFTYSIEGPRAILEWDVANDKPTWDILTGSTITPIL